MKNFVQPGATITFTAAAPVASGDGVLMGTLFGVASTSAEIGMPFEAALSGVFSLPKEAVVMTAGAAVYWNATAGNATTVATGNKLIGATTEAATSGATAARIRLNGVAVV
ncbi:DUF2190 family protein [Hoeflea sp.]|jgi:predicted RecA/RadA family phage recombinase|uniref:DUF2190 family protein n=1 Tax=Hoeflea sp. TaxID=1940281 RepID=UPI0019C9FCC6|nr:DUF2190 family protein [Hoeflea sp.]MBC7286006.1 DUF2190 family protein [Hoeflea sp.]